MNNNRIFIVRGDADKLIAHTIEVPYGQPVFVNDKNYLVVGQKVGNKKSDKFENLSPVVVRQLIGYFDDNTKMTSKKTMPYSIKPTTGELEISSCKDILIKVDDEKYIKLNKDAHKVIGKTYLENLFAKNISGDNDIVITENGNKNIVVNRIPVFNKAIKVNAGVRSKFQVFGSENGNDYILVNSESDKPFFINTSTSQLQGDVIVGTDNKTANLTVKGDISSSGIISVPTIRTKSSGARVVIDDNKVSVFTGKDKGTSMVVDYNGATFDKKAVFNDTVTFSTDIESKTNITANKMKVTELTVADLVIS